MTMANSIFLAVFSLLAVGFGTNVHARICRGGNSCCSPENRCYINEGDCDQNDDCTYGLVCGTNNCVGDTFDSTDDCCMQGDPDTVSNVDLSENQDDDMEDYEFSAVQAFGMAGM